MIEFKCSNCSRQLKVDDSLAGRRIRCPACKRAASVPEELQDEAQPAWVFLLIGVACCVFLFLILAATLGPTSGIAIMLTFAALAFAVWQRERLAEMGRAFVAYLDEVKQRQDEARRQREQEEFTSSTESPSHPPARSARPLVAHSAPRRSRRRVATQADIRFHGTNSTLDSGQLNVESPLVYHVCGVLDHADDASVIEDGLTVDARGDVAESLPYWPSFRQCSPSQRRIYIDWLNGVRRDPNIPLGYVFIYFYGLERRVLIDHVDHETIAHEVLRLLNIYSDSNSFRRYGQSFLWAIINHGASLESVSSGLVQRVTAATTYWSDDNISSLLAYYFNRDLPLPVEAAVHVAEKDPRTPRSVVIRRHLDRFRSLFETKFAEEYPDGLSLKAAKRARRFEYRTASATIDRDLYAYGDSELARQPNVLGITSQFKPLVRIWSECIDQLKGFDRAHKKAAGDEMTAAMYEALPDQLRTDDHPDFDRWYEVTNQHLNEDGWVVAPISALAEIRGIAPRPRLTKTQCQQLLLSADAMELAIEPDARVTGQNYRWEEPVSVFPKDLDSDGHLKSYHAASILLRLGMIIAEADGQVDDLELARITNHLEMQFDLSAQEATRLEHLQYLLLHTPDAHFKITKRLRELLSHTQRGMIGKFLVAVAAVDEVITKDEHKALKKAYRDLGLDPAELDEVVAGHVSVSDSAQEDESDLVLDSERIRAIMADTAMVADFLQDALADVSEMDSSDDDDAEDKEGPMTFSAWNEQEPPATNQTPAATTDDNEKNDSIDPGAVALNGLPERYHSFLQTAMGRDSWTVDELDAIARQHRLMMAGAVEVINEWSLEEYGEWLFEEDENVINVHRKFVD